MDVFEGVVAVAVVVVVVVALGGDRTDAKGLE